MHCIPQLAGPKGYWIQGRWGYPRAPAASCTAVPVVGINLGGTVNCVLPAQSLNCNNVGTKTAAEFCRRNVLVVNVMAERRSYSCRHDLFTLTLIIFINCVVSVAGCIPGQTHGCQLACCFMQNARRHKMLPHMHACTIWLKHEVITATKASIPRRKRLQT